MDWITPMEPISSSSIPSGEEWIFQIKWDGIRGLTYYQRRQGEDHVRIFTKSGRERTEYYPELHHIGNLVAGNNAVLDGEMVVPDNDGKPSFHLSLIREKTGRKDKLPHYIRKYPVIYIVFDILYLNDCLLTELPLKERRNILYQSLNQDGNIAITEDFEDGPGLYDLMKRKGWEGIVSKKKNSLYCPAKNHSEWFKHKNLKKILAAICGIQWKDSLPNSLILGIFRDDSWVYIGKASQGLTFEERRQLKQYAVRHRNDDCPFRDVRLCKGESFTWLKPAVTCWIRFLEWTNDGTMRHPAILGFSHLSAEQANGKEWSIDE